MSIGKGFSSFSLVMLKIVNTLVILGMIFAATAMGVIPALFCDAGPVSHCLAMGGMIGGIGLAIGLSISIPLVLSLYRPGRLLRVALVLYSVILIAVGASVGAAQGHVAWLGLLALIGVANLFGIALFGLGKPKSNFV